MAYIDRNESNQITSTYAVSQREGQEYLEGAVLYTQPPSPIQQIRAIEAAQADAVNKIVRQSLLALALDKAHSDPMAVGLTREQVHAALMATNNGYAQWWNMEQAIIPLRAQL